MFCLPSQTFVKRCYFAKHVSIITRFFQHIAEYFVEKLDFGIIKIFITRTLLSNEKVLNCAQQLGDFRMPDFIFLNRINKKIVFSIKIAAENVYDHSLWNSGTTKK